MSDNPIEKLTTFFIRFPGIGPRQAKRFVYFLLKQDQTSLNNLSRAIANLKNETAQCTQCFRYFTDKNPKGAKLCEVCLDLDRDGSLLMVVEKDADLDVIRRSDDYIGKFFILGGLVPILDKNPNTRIRINELKKYLTEKRPSEVILALSVNPEGDHTVEYLNRELSPLVKEFGFKISTLGRGLSTGTELEYSDTETLNQALKNRH